MFSDNLQALRKMHDLSQEELADRIGVTRQTLSKYENGESLPDIEKCRLLADVFGVTVDNLLNFESGRSENMGFSVPPRGKHLFGIVRMDDKGQIVIPEKARQIFGLEPGDDLLVLGDEGQGIAIVKEKGLLDLLKNARSNAEQ